MSIICCTFAAAKVCEYLQLVKAALWGEPIVWPEEQTESLLLLNAQQGTGALVYPNVLGQEDIPALARAQMKSVCVNALTEQVKLHHTLQQAWTALLKAGIQPVLLKGAGLAALYPSPEQRAYGDIDLFVGKEQYHPACRVMRETFPNALKFDEELDHYKHYNLIADGVSIEIHRVSVGLQHPLDEKRYAQMEAFGMAAAEEKEIAGLKVLIPEATFNALFVFLHSWEHMLSQGANVRQLCDLTMILHHGKDAINQLQLKRWLRSLHLLDVWQLYAYTMVNGLGLPRNDTLLYTDQVAERAERMMDDLLGGRMKAPNHKGAAPKGRFARKLFTMRERLANAQRIAQYSPVYARHMVVETMIHGALRLFAKDRRWE